jgi:hypothetical protein
MYRYTDYKPAISKKGKQMTQPDPVTETSPPQGKKLLDQYRDVINLKHYSPRTGTSAPKI